MPDGALPADGVSGGSRHDWREHSRVAETDRVVVGPISLRWSAGFTRALILTAVGLAAFTVGTYVGVWLAMTRHPDRPATPAEVARELLK